MTCPPICGRTKPTHHSLPARPWPSRGFRKARHQSLLQSAQPNIPWGPVPSGRGGGFKRRCPLVLSHGHSCAEAICYRSVSHLIQVFLVHHWSPPSDPNWRTSFAVPQLCPCHLFALLPNTSLYSEESGSPLPPQTFAVTILCPSLSLWVLVGEGLWGGVSRPCSPPGSYVVKKSYMDPPRGPDLTLPVLSC